VVGLFLLTSVFIFSLFGWVDSRQSERFGVIALYWHFVDGVWIVVFTVVYLIGR
jgi:cytochrome c oxidase subunit 3/cytochrome o ubiquinol oxidase subunit 3